MDNSEIVSCAPRTNQEILIPLLAEDDDSLFWTPTRTGKMSAWWGHVPFAHWLVSALKPRLVVELGTHHGVSFAAFCEAMQRQKVLGKCFAIDTWQGDEHAGFYDETVYHDLNQFIQQRYAPFAELLRLTFDQAIPYFADGSIDLLHIDGLHTYDAVKQDFDNWYPKLSPRAVVLFHDTNVREMNFGVWKFWVELQERYQTFEFFHSHGLGIAVVGEDAPLSALTLCNLAPDAASVLRERCALIGTRWMVGEVATDTAKHASNLSLENERQRKSLVEYSQHVENLETERLQIRESLAANLAEFEARTARLLTERAAQEAIINDLQTRHAAEKAAQDALIDDLQTRYAAEKTDYAATLRAVHDTATHNQSVLKAEIDAICASPSWRITRPLRTLNRLGQGIRQKLRAAAPAPFIAFEAQRPAAMDADIKLIADSGFFDADYYVGTAEAHAMGLSPIAHYLRKGEAEGLAPSVAFDPNFYLDRYPDLRGHIASSLLHFCHHGRQEGRRCRPIADTVVLPTRQILPDRATVIVVVHEATRTGAAILGWNILRALKKNYNVVALLIRGGPIEQAFEDIGDTVMLPADFVWIDAESDALARKMIACYAPRYVIANSVETRHVVPAFEKAGVPTLALIHEFSSNIQPGALHGLIKHAAKIIFSAQIVADSAIADYPDLPARSLVILPQGSSVLPPNNAIVSTSGDAELKDIGVLPADNGTFLVVGIGTITLRKGVEFFIAAAARARRLAPDRNIVFAWVGKCYAFDAPYLAYLREQIQRTGLDSAFMFLGEFEDLAPVYARADLFILSSRLDPLPNVGIDAAVHGVPVICFDQASGIAEILKAAPQTAGLVVPYLDAGAAGDLVVALASDTPRLRAFSDGMRDVAQTHFDMTRYVAALDALGQQALQAKAQMERDHATIKRHDAFNAALYLDASKAAMPTDKALRHYLEASALVAPRGRPRTGMLLRRPLEGFHPLIYAAENRDFDETSGEDPLAHYARTGRPKGRWHHEVIQPGPSNPPVAAPLRAVIHGHFHYPELLEEFLLRLKANKTPTDLLLTTTSQSRGRQIEQIVAKAKTPNVTVSIVPNQGRDIGVFLSGIEHEMLMRYDLVGHLHGKRSPHAEGTIGESWRHFLWENLLGGEHAMVDVIANAFASDQTLGLVFAEDPHLNDWDRNRPFADDLATRMDLLPLPNHFDFPHGNMFWARPQALKPMFDLGLHWDDYPAEPVPIDGTLLHALERLTPLAAQNAGYRFATTYLPSLTR